MFKSIMKILLKQFYKRNPDICAWCIPVNENIDIHYIVEKSYLDRHEFGTKVECYEEEMREYERGGRWRDTLMQICF